MHFFCRRRILMGRKQLNTCLQGGVRFPTGGIVRDRASIGCPLTRCNSGTDSEASVKEAQSGWKKIIAAELRLGVLLCCLFHLGKTQYSRCFQDN